MARFDSGQRYDSTIRYDQDEPVRKVRRPTISLETLNLPQNMQPFRYIIYFIKNLFTAKAALRDAVPEGEFLDTLATRSGLSRVQVEKVITELFGLLLEYARQSIPVDTVLKRFRMQPSAGGRYQGPDPDADEVRDTLTYSLIVHPDELAKVRAECPVEKVGESGEKTPEVDSVRARPGNIVGKYGVGASGATEVNGSHFRDSGASTEWPTAALVDENGGTPLVLAVLDCTPTRLLLAGAPAGTTGTRYLKVTDAEGNFTVDDQPLTAL